MTDDSYRGKVRAVFLATIMVLSMVAMAATFAAPAAATAPEEISGQELDDRSTVYSGQKLNITIDTTSGGFPGFDDTASEVDLIRITDRADGDYDLVRSFSATNQDTSGSLFVEEVTTDNRDTGLYAIANASDQQNLSDLETIRFNIGPAGVNADFEDETVDDTDAAQEITLESDRTTQYNVTVYADGLDDDQLEDIFDHPGDNGVQAHNDSEEDFAPLDYLNYDAPWDNDDDFDNVSDIRDDGYLSLNLNDNSNQQASPDDFDLVANFSNLDENEGLPETGEYEFNFIVNDQGIETSDSVTISSEDPEASFDQNVYQESAGDLVDVTVDLDGADDAYMQFGDEDANFVDPLYLDDDDDDGDVTFTVNTRLVGSNHSNTTNSGLDVDADAVYYSNDDEVESLLHDGVIEGDLSSDAFDENDHFFDDSDIDGNAFSGDLGNQYVAYLEELDIIGTSSASGSNIEDADEALGQLVRPLQPTTYDMAVSEDGYFIAEDGESSVDTEIGYATLELEQPGIEAVNTWTAPEQDADDANSASGLVEGLTQTDSVAIDDLVVAQFEADGLYGAIAAEYYDENGDYDDLDEDLDAEYLGSVADDTDPSGQAQPWEYEGITMTFEDTGTSGNQDENALELFDSSTNDVAVYFGNDTENFYVAVDSDAEPFPNDLSDGDTFDVELEYETDSDDRAEFNSSLDEPAIGGPAVEAGGNEIASGGDESYPYFDTGESAIASTTFTFEDADVTFDNVDDGAVRLNPAEGAVVSGTTNVAPGSDASVRVSQRGDNASFLYTEDVEVAEDGTFEAELDMSDRAAGDQASVEFRVRGSTVDTQNGVFGEAEVDQPFTPSVSIDAPSTAAPGDEVTVDVTASNDGDETGSATWTATVDGEEVASQDTELEGGASETISETRTVPENASDGATITIESSYGNASDSATVTVEAEDAGDDQADSEDSGTPGFGVAVAALALLSAALLARFRN